MDHKQSSITSGTKSTGLRKIKGPSIQRSIHRIGSESIPGHLRHQNPGNKDQEDKKFSKLQERRKSTNLSWGLPNLKTFDVKKLRSNVERAKSAGSESINRSDLFDGKKSASSFGSERTSELRKSLTSNICSIQSNDFTIDKAKTISGLSLDRKRKKALHHQQWKKAKEKLKTKKNVDLAVKDANDKFLKLPSVHAVDLTEISLRTIGLKLGEDITGEKPWKLVKKSKIWKLIDWLEEFTEFWPLKDEIENYPEPEILMGWKPTLFYTGQTFYLVLSLESRERIEEILRKKEAALQAKIANIMNRTVGKWKSLGSEAEVDLITIPNMRGLFDIEITTKYPVHKTTKFSVRLVQDARDGYVELLPDPRKDYQVVVRRRVDSCVQASAVPISVGIQTEPLLLPVNKITQFPDESYEPGKEESQKILDKLDKKMKIFKTEKFAKNQDRTVFDPKTLKMLEKELFLNFHYNFYTNDYEELEKMSTSSWRFNKKGTSIDFKFVLFFSELKTTKNAVVRAGSWYGFKSGLLALCYSEYAASTVGTTPSEIHDVDAASDGGCPVLLWSYSRPLKPLLYFDTPRDVTALSFCPYRHNILVGGCKSGQIIIWDMTNRLEKVEKRKVMNYKEELNSFGIWGKCRWFKNVFDESHVDPIYLSSLSNSHTNAIVSIRWIHPYLSPSDEEQWIQRETHDRTLKRLGFMTLSLDGTIIFWDHRLDKPAEIVRRRKIKFAPPGLDEYKIKVRRDIEPSLKVLVKRAGKFIPIAADIRHANKYSYKPVSNVSPDFKIRTDFVLEEIPEPSAVFQRFVIATTRGEIKKLKWNNTSFDVKTRQRIVQAEVEKINYTHDGPVTAAMFHPSHQEFYITVGGTTFAIWSEKSNYPLIWRKASNGSKYMSAVWGTRQPSYIIAVRYDGCVEVWDIIRNLLKPIKTFNLGGDLITNVIGPLTGNHVRKDTFAMTDDMGSCSILWIPPYERPNADQHLAEVKRMFEGLTVNRTKVWKWINAFEDKFYEDKRSHAMKFTDSFGSLKSHKHFLKFSIQTSASTVPSELDENRRIHKLFTEIDKNPRLKYMYESLLGRKQLKISDVEKPYKCLYHKDVEREKIKQKIINSDYREKALQNITLEISKEQHVLGNPSYIFNQEPIDIPDNYEEVQTFMLEYIKENPFKMEMDFLETLNRERSAFIDLRNRLNLTKKKPRLTPSPKSVESLLEEKETKKPIVHFDGFSGTELFDLKSLHRPEISRE